MKRFSLLSFVLFVALMCVFTACKKDKEEPKEPAGWDIVTPTPDPTPEDPTKGMENGHAWVDLGEEFDFVIATMNVGATSVEGSGNYYAWGETETKADYSWGTYTLCNGATNTFTKYCNDASKGNEGYTDELMVLEAADDVAHVLWGGNWRMPTKDEFVELQNNCTWEWTTENEVCGYRVTGTNGNSIFLSAAGYRNGTNLIDFGVYGYYWSSELYVYSDGADCIYFKSDSYSWFGNFRYYGKPVRAVCTK